MKIYFIRHQAGGVIHDAPFESPPTPAQCAAVLARVPEFRENDRHPKTGEPYWVKVICVENGVTTTIGGANGESAEEINAKASGHCPIRAAGHKRTPGSGEPGKAAAGGALDAIASGTGNVRNP